MQCRAAASWRAQTVRELREYGAACADVTVTSKRRRCVVVKQRCALMNCATFVSQAEGHKSWQMMLLTRFGSNTASEIGSNTQLNLHFGTVTGHGSRQVLLSLHLLVIKGAMTHGAAHDAAPMWQLIQIVSLCCCV